MKDETALVAIKEFVRLKQKISSLLVEDSSECKKAKGMNKDVGARMSHNDYRDIWLHKKYLLHLMNRIQSKNHKKEA